MRITAKHEFGIMKKEPVPGERYDAYEPEMYECTAVSDEHIEKIISEIAKLTMYWHTVDLEAKGLIESGITLIPPSAIRGFLKIINGKREYNCLKRILEEAYASDRWVIHFGL